MVFSKQTLSLVALLAMFAACDSNDAASSSPPVLTDKGEYALQRVEIFGDGQGFFILDDPITFTFTNQTNAPAFIRFCPNSNFSLTPAYQKQVGSTWREPFILDALPILCDQYAEIAPGDTYQEEHNFAVSEDDLHVDSIEGTYRFSIAVYSEPTDPDLSNPDLLLPLERRMSNEFRLSLQE